MKKKLDALKSGYKGEIRLREPMSRHTSFGIGGAADLFLVPKGPADLAAALRFFREEGTPFFILGNGTNLLVSDAGIEGAVIKLNTGFSRVAVSGNLVQAGAGVPLVKLADLMAEKGLSGLEFAGGIPGTLGGGLVMNAGAYDHSLSEVVRNIRILDEETKVRYFLREEWGFGYRKGGLRPGWVILGATLELRPGKPDEIRRALRKMREMRAESQPLEMRSAGSVFKNPEGRSAWELVHAVGGTGMKRGGAAVSEKHSNFIVNAGEARAEEVWWLVEELKKRIYEQFKIEIVPEILRVGRW